MDNFQIVSKLIDIEFLLRNIATNLEFLVKKLKENTEPQGENKEDQ